MQFLKADTSVKVVIGPVVAVGDGYTPVTNLSLSTADEAEVMKHDAASVTDISGNTFAAITSMDGYYNLTLTAGNVDTEGMLTVGINDDSLCLPVIARFTVVNANVYDSLFAVAATDYLQVDVIQVGGASEDIATETKQDTIDTNVDAILVDTGTTLDGKLDTIDTNVDAILVDTGTTLDGKIDNIEADTNELQTDWANGGRLDLLIDACSTHAAADVLAANVEGTRTLAEEVRLMAAALVGKSSGGGTTTLVFRDIDDSKDRITATVDANGNRTAMTLVDS